MIKNMKTVLNSVVLKFVNGDRQLAERWWKSLNKAFDGKTPISMWKGGSASKKNLRNYVLAQLYRSIQVTIAS